ncbi:LuxR family two component transcriptional regulator [Stackebrandtia endophytica]|uniref:LuxR family two component transcriptional regulator n=1 Tax=Stackebrandtia endophytica TaxID=1496996 RepID=A0A543B4E2_9ACTN|nr:response regulator transcription factor [Stackebrandtia endophytica]TQL79692.1 LuxR family two component transcriptional regulator [Stackebrandtia endophytica]
MTTETAEQDQSVSVLIADDHPVVRQGLRTFLELQPGLRIVGEAADGDETLQHIEKLHPDVVLLDLHMPGRSGQEVLAVLAERGDPARVIVLTSVTDSREVAPAIQAGAAGFLYKDVDPDSLARAIRSVHEGQVLFAPGAVAAMAAGPAPQLSQLTDRERQVLSLVAAGLSNRQISTRLTVAEKTVKTHLSSIFRKLGVTDRTQAALYAVRHGL